MTHTETPSGILQELRTGAIPAIPSPAAPAVPAPSPVTVGTDEDAMPDPLLLYILSTKRRHNSTGDTNFRLWLHAEIKKLGYTPEIAKEGSIIVTTDKKSTTLFSCHIDTVHNSKECDGSRQDLNYDPAFGDIFLQDKTANGPNCLGGDDGVGVYLLLKMIAAKVKGSYVFHTGEECGGIGARAILETRKPWLESFDRCIAFDRAVKSGESPEVVVRQGGTQCASDTFGAELVKALNSHSFPDPWVISHGGVFTDSKVYAGVIPECINLGCFYVNQHTPNETVNAWGVEDLLAACLKIKWNDLKASRQPMAGYGHYELPKKGKAKGGYVPPVARPAQNNFGGFEFGYGSDLTDAEIDAAFDRSVAKHERTQGAKKALFLTPKSALEELLNYTHTELLQMAEDEPERMANAVALLVIKYKGLKAEDEAIQKMLEF